MNPRGLMWHGALAGFAAFLAYVAGHYDVAFVLGFGGGMVFGKGYGVWEERTRDA